MQLRQLIAPLSIAILLSACASDRHHTHTPDYSKFKQSNPHSILVVQPTNDSVNVHAPYSVMAQTTQPLAESGYYVFPVVLVNETFKNNGLNDGAEIQAVQLNKIRQIYNPDAVLYLNVEDYGTKYKVISSVTTVTVNAKLIDAKDGTVLWTGRKNITVDSNNNNNSGTGLFSMMVNAVINQVSDKVFDRAYKIAGVVDDDLLSAKNKDSILYGPYSPNYKPPLTEPAAQQ